MRSTGLRALPTPHDRPQSYRLPRRYQRRPQPRRRRSRQRQCPGGLHKGWQSAIGRPPSGGGGEPVLPRRRAGKYQTRLLTDGGGLVTDRYSYTAFGELIDHVGSDVQPYQFAGVMRMGLLLLLGCSYFQGDQTTPRVFNCLQHHQPTKLSFGRPRPALGGRKKACQKVPTPTLGEPRNRHRNQKEPSEISGELVVRGE